MASHVNGVHLAYHVVHGLDGAHNAHVSTDPASAEQGWNRAMRWPAPIEGKVTGSATPVWLGPDHPDFKCKPPKEGSVATMLAKLPHGVYKRPYVYENGRRDYYHCAGCGDRIPSLTKALENPAAHQSCHLQAKVRPPVQEAHSADADGECRVCGGGLTARDGVGMPLDLQENYFRDFGVIAHWRFHSHCANEMPRVQVQNKALRPAMRDQSDPDKRFKLLKDAIKKARLPDSPVH